MPPKIPRSRYQWAITYSLVVAQPIRTKHWSSWILLNIYIYIISQSDKTSENVWRQDPWVGNDYSPANNLVNKALVSHKLESWQQPRNTKLLPPFYSFVRFYLFSFTYSIIKEYITVDSLDGTLRVGPCLFYFLHLTLYKTDISLRRTLRIAPRGVRLIDTVDCKNLVLGAAAPSAKCKSALRRRFLSPLFPDIDFSAQLKERENQFRHQPFQVG